MPPGVPNPWRCRHTALSCRHTPFAPRVANRRCPGQTFARDIHACVSQLLPASANYFRFSPPDVEVPHRHSSEGEGGSWGGFVCVMGGGGQDKMQDTVEEQRVGP